MSNTAVYSTVDHVMIRLLDIDPLLSLFTDVFGLPVSWPKQSSSFATFAWVHVGNTELELWASASNSDLPKESQPPLIHGFALEPVDLEASVAHLTQAGLQCKSPRPYQTKTAEGSLTTNFTNSVLLDLSSDSCCIFFCAWNPEGTIYPWKERLTTAERRARDQLEMTKCGGGTIGLVGLSEIEMSTPNLSDAEKKWRLLTDSAGEEIELTADMVLRLTQDSRQVIQSLTFEVRSLESARDFLLANGLLGVSSENEISLESTAIGGLRMKFRQAREAAQ
jgi:hypothetical protein